jgi:hypothetical protein
MIFSTEREAMEFKPGEVIYKAIERLDTIKSAEDWAKVNTAYVVLPSPIPEALIARLHVDALQFRSNNSNSPYVLAARVLDEDGDEVWQKSQHDANMMAAMMHVQHHRQEVEEAQKDLADAEEKLAWLQLPADKKSTPRRKR